MACHQTTKHEICVLKANNALKHNYVSGHMGNKIIVSVDRHSTVNILKGLLLIGKSYQIYPI